MNHSKTNLAKQDQQYCWHPFTQAAFSLPNLLIERSEGIYLIDAQNKKYMDAISSWWVVTHGHNHTKIAQAVAMQCQNLSHTLFSGVTHPPAIQFASQLIQYMKTKGFDFQWVFYSDNGSTAIEAALKMAVQYHDNLAKNNHPTKNLESTKTKKSLKFMAFEGAYHGDTFGAMAVGKTSGFYRAFEDWLFAVDFIEYPELKPQEEDVFTTELNASEINILEKLDAHLAQNHKNIAAFIFEPIIQGASGMRFAKIIFLQKILQIFKKYNILTIADEVMTGFGRTGPLFACEYLLEEPFFGQSIDMMCLSKGITGGFMAMGATVVRDEIYQAFLSQDVYQAFLHGHSYTANPIACAAACANLELFLEKDLKKQTQSNLLLYKSSNSPKLPRLETLEHWQLFYLHDLIKRLNEKAAQIFDVHTNIFKNPRVLGGIAAFNGLNDFFETLKNIHPLKKTGDMNGVLQANYGSAPSQYLRLACLELGLLLRPLGDCIYIMPPYCITKEEVAKIYEVLYQVFSDILEYQVGTLDDTLENNSFIGGIEKNKMQPEIQTLIQTQAEDLF